VSSAARVLRPEGSLFLNVGSKPTDPWTALDIAQAARPHLKLQNVIHWIKSIAIDRDSAGASAGLTKDLAVGHYKPINSPRFLNDCHEFILHFTTKGTTALDRLALGVPYQDQSNVGRWQGASADVRCRGNTWFIPYKTIQRRDRDRPHPATFPVRLPEQCLRLHGLSRIEMVMDPFLGLGSTAVACARLGLPFIGVEIDKSYLTEAIARTTAEIDGRTEKAELPNASLETSTEVA
jgi:site-specific DNA-methyltransferase (adenine-specific)